jgi:hypothetical protein
MADNDILTELKSINKRLDGLDQGQKNVGQGLADVKQTQAQHGTILKAVAAGQNELQKIVAKEADLLDLQSDLGKKVKDHEVRIENLEDHTGTHNPHKN